MKLLCTVQNISHNSASYHVRLRDSNKAVEVTQPFKRLRLPFSIVLCTGHVLEIFTFFPRREFSMGNFPTTLLLKAILIHTLKQ